MIWLYVFGGWFLISIPAAILTGRWFAHHDRSSVLPADPR